RRNAQKSAGPGTARGKAVSGTNALGHGGLARSVVARSRKVNEWAPSADNGSPSPISSPRGEDSPSAAAPYTWDRDCRKVISERTDGRTRFLLLGEKARMRASPFPAAGAEYEDFRSCLRGAVRTWGFWPRRLCRNVLRESRAR